MVGTLVLEASEEIREGSSPSLPTNGVVAKLDETRQT